MDDQRLTQLEDSIEEIRAGQKEIAAALLGGYGEGNVGLREEARNLRRELDELKASSKLYQLQISEAIQFKKDAKKVVLGISVIVPFLCELLKLGAMGIWELYKLGK